MLTFIFMAYGINHFRVRKTLQSIGLNIRTRYRTALIGLCYGIVLYFVKDYRAAQAETLFQSFVFTLVFHKLLLEKLLLFLAPASLKKHIRKTENNN